MTMGFSKASENHSQRKMDLSLFPSLLVTGGSATVGFPPAKFVAGRSKEAQRFISCLMTPLGAVASDPEMGSEFAGYIGTRANLSFFYEIESLFSAESLRVLVWMNRILPKDRPNDEKILDAVLSNWAATGTSIEMEVTFFFADGTPGTVLVPVSLPVPENRII